MFDNFCKIEFGKVSDAEKASDKDAKLFPWQRMEFGLEELEVTSDPNAQGFYEKYGFELFDKIESQPKGRFLPVLKRKIK